MGDSVLATPSCLVTCFYSLLFVPLTGDLLSICFVTLASGLQYLRGLHEDNRGITSLGERGSQHLRRKERPHPLHSLAFSTPVRRSCIFGITDVQWSRPLSRTGLNTLKDQKLSHSDIFVPFAGLVCWFFNSMFSHMSRTRALNHTR
jgi:hypothetical protein